MRGAVLIVDDDEEVSGLVAEILRDEGFAVTTLADKAYPVLSGEVARIEPDLVLLDGGDAAGYGQSWEIAAWLHERARPVPVIMFTAHARELAEAEQSKTERSRRAAFIGLVGKPFDLQYLIDVVGRALTEHQVLGDPPVLSGRIAFPATNQSAVAEFGRDVGLIRLPSTA